MIDKLNSSVFFIVPTLQPWNAHGDARASPISNIDFNFSHFFLDPMRRATAIKLRDILCILQ